MSTVTAPAPELAPVPPPAERITHAGEPRSARIESVRALAALGVFFGHTFAFAVAFEGLTVGSYKDRLLLGGGMGVYLFFTLSGYLLFLPFAKRAFHGGRVSLRRYARNRLLRIVPLFYAITAVLLVVRPHDADPGDWWRWALFIQNYSIETTTKLDSPAWSLDVEMQFYVLLPLLGYGLARLCRGRAALGALVITALGVASWILRDARVLGAEDAEPQSALVGAYSLPSTFYMFAAGMLLALLKLELDRRPRATPLPGILGSSTTWLLAAAASYFLLCIDYAHQEPGVALASVVLIGACVLPLRHGRTMRVLEWRPLALVGIASYSLYLLHVPILETLTGTYSVVLEDQGQTRITGEPTDFKGLLAIATPVCLLAAALSYRLVEAPFLRLRGRWAG